MEYVWRTTQDELTVGLDHLFVSLHFDTYAAA